MEYIMTRKTPPSGFRITTLLLFTLYGLFVGGCQSSSVPDADLVITNVNIVDVNDGKVLKNKDVFITSDKISRIAETGSFHISANVLTLDGSDKFLLPGLWDAHVHVISNSEWQMPLMLAHGITSVRNMHTTEPEPLKAIARVKADIEAGTYPSPRLLASGPIIDGPSNYAWPEAIIVHSPQEARNAVIQQKKEGADFIKVYSALSEPSTLAILEQAKESGLAVDGHMPNLINPAKAAKAGMRTVEHTSGLFAGCSDNQKAIQSKFQNYFTGEALPFPQSQLEFFSLLVDQAAGYNRSKCRVLLKTYAKNGVAAVPTLVNSWAAIHSANILNDDKALSYMPAPVRDFWTSAASAPFNGDFIAHLSPIYEHAAHLTMRMDNAGVAILAGTDVGNPFLIPGVALHQELTLLTEAGLSNLDALRAATSTPAKTFGFEDSLGQIAVGFTADLVLLNADPLKDISAIRNIEAVTRSGKLYDRASLDKILSNVRQFHQ